MDNPRRGDARSGSQKKQEEMGARHKFTLIWNWKREGEDELEHLARYRSEH